MQRLVKIVISIWLLSGACDICAAEGKSNLGQDPTRPRSRLDLRVKYQQITSDLELVKLTARVDHPIALDNGWKLNTRISQGFFFSEPLPLAEFEQQFISSNTAKILHV